MRVQTTGAQFMFADGRVSARYDVLDDSGKVVGNGVADVVVSSALFQAALAEVQAIHDSQLAQLIASLPAAEVKPSVVTDAFLQVGLAKTEEAQKRQLIAELDAQIAAKTAAVAAVAAVKP